MENLVQNSDIWRRPSFLKQVLLHSKNIFRTDTFWKKLVFQKINKENYQRTFISKMEWAPFKYLFWNANDSIVKFLGLYFKWCFFVIQTLLYKICWIMITTTNAENLRQCQRRFSLIVEQILVFRIQHWLAQNSSEFVSKFQTNYTTMFYVINNFHSDRWSILSLNFNHFCQRHSSISLCTVNGNYFFL